MGVLSKRLEHALESAKSWPLERQDAAAEVLEGLNMLTDVPLKLTAGERADLEDALAEVRRGDLATDTEVAAVFSKHGL